MKTQRLANRYPLWSKVRADASSMGQRLFSVFGELFDSAGADALKVREHFRLSKRAMPPGYVYQVELGEDDYAIRSPGTGWSYPVVQGLSGTDTYSLTRTDYVEQLIFALPDRLTHSETLTVDSFTVWSSVSPLTYVQPPQQERLAIHVYGSTDYQHRETHKDPGFSGVNRVSIKGYDSYAIQFTEHVDIRDDGVYYTRASFAKVTEVDVNGFDGTVVVGLGAPRPHSSVYEPDPFRPAVTDDLEGPLKLSLSDSGGYSYLTYFTDIYKLGWKYRRDGAFDENTEDITSQALLDSDGTAFTAVDLAVDPHDARLYVLDSAGKVHVYEHGLVPFTYPSLDIATEEAYVTVEPMGQRVQLNEVVKCFTYFYEPEDPILKVTIRRISPSGTTEYLQANKTWATALYEFKGVDDPNTTETSWREFDFTLTPDEFGVWELYTTAVTARATTVAYTALSAESITADASFTLPVSISSPEVLFFSHDGKLAVGNSSNIYKFNRHRDNCFIDTDAQIVYVAENYDTVRVNP